MVLQHTKEKANSRKDHCQNAAESSKQASTALIVKKPKLDKENENTYDHVLTHSQHVITSTSNTSTPFNFTGCSSITINYLK